MKKLFVLVVAVLMGISNVSAQQREGGRQRMTVEVRVAQLTKSLELTAEQQKKITTIYQELEKKRQASTNTSREQMRANAQAAEQEVAAVLTDAQKQKYEELKKARRSGAQKGARKGAEKQ